MFLLSDFFESSLDYAFSIGEIMAKVFRVVQLKQSSRSDISPLKTALHSPSVFSRLSFCCLVIPGRASVGTMEVCSSALKLNGFR